MSKQRDAAHLAKLVDKVIEQNVAAVGVDANGVRLRAQHGKSHGCVEARFDVLADVPEALRHGVFANPESYRAAVRFSNGARTDDREPDAHGMAVKLFDVEGDWVDEDGSGEALSRLRQQDFVLTDTDTFPSFEPDDYEATNRLVTGVLAFRRAPLWRRVTDLSLALEAARSVFKAVATREGAARRRSVGAFASQIMRSPLETHYWSTQPYRLGPDATVRYLARSDRFRRADRPVDDVDGIGAGLRSSIAEGNAAFDFCAILPPTGLKAEDLLDCRLRWASDSPYHAATPADPRHPTVMPIARLHFEKGAEFDPIDGQGMAFTPWNALEAHRPLGPINEMRRLTYARLAAERFPTK